MKWVLFKSQAVQWIRCLCFRYTVLLFTVHMPTYWPCVKSKKKTFLSLFNQEYLKSEPVAGEWTITTHCPTFVNL